MKNEALSLVIHTGTFLKVAGNAEKIGCVNCLRKLATFFAHKYQQKKNIFLFIFTYISKSFVISFNVKVYKSR